MGNRVYGFNRSGMVRTVRAVRTVERMVDGRSPIPPFKRRPRAGSEGSRLWTISTSGSNLVFEPTFVLHPLGSTNGTALTIPATYSGYAYVGIYVHTPHIGTVTIVSNATGANNYLASSEFAGRRENWLLYPIVRLLFDGAGGYEVIQEYMTKINYGAIFSYVARGALTIPSIYLGVSGYVHATLDRHGPYSYMLANNGWGYPYGNGSRNIPLTEFTGGEDNFIYRALSGSSGAPYILGAVRTNSATEDSYTIPIALVYCDSNKTPLSYLEYLPTYRFGYAVS